MQTVNVQVHEQMSKLGLLEVNNDNIFFSSRPNHYEEALNLIAAKSMQI